MPKAKLIDVALEELVARKLSNAADIQAQREKLLDEGLVRDHFQKTIDNLPWKKIENELAEKVENLAIERLAKQLEELHTNKGSTVALTNHHLDELMGGLSLEGFAKAKQILQRNGFVTIASPEGIEDETAPVLYIATAEEVRKQLNPFIPKN